MADTDHFHPEKLKHHPATAGVIVDLLMVLLVIVNLSLIIFDWLFSSPFTQELLTHVSPKFVEFYGNTIHADFIFYDMLFVSVYLCEFGIRWIIALWRNTYHRWFFYPFVHWYDLLGCIPVGSFRWLRILRIVSILVRLQRMGVIELQETYAGKFFLTYYRIVIEEISDRVVINVLENIQTQNLQGHPLVESIRQDVLLPRKAQFIHLLVERIQQTSANTWQSSRPRLNHYLQNLSEELILNSKAGTAIAAVPFFGQRMLGELDRQLTQLLLEIVDKIIADLASAESQAALEKTIDDLLSNLGADGSQIAALLDAISLDTLEAVKAQVRIQQWKVTEKQNQLDLGIAP